MKKIILILGDHKIQKIVGSVKTYALDTNVSFRIKEVMCTNTFLIRRGEKFTEIDHVLELQPRHIFKEQVWRQLEFSSLKNLENGLDLRKFYLTETEIQKLANELKLLKVEEKYYKVRYEDIRDMLVRRDTCYKDWKKMFNFSSAELGLYCLLICYENSMLEEFTTEWNKYDLEPCSIKELIKHLEYHFLPNQVKLDILRYLRRVK